MTLKQLADHWRAQRVTAQGRQLSPRTLNEYQRLIESTLAKFKDRPIRQITRQQIEAWRAPEIVRAANQTTKAYKHLKTLMTFAQKRAWVAVNPCDLERATNYTPASKPPIPSMDQVELMLAEANGPLKAIIALASWGGLRRGEIFELRRKDLEIIKGKPGEQTLVLVQVRRAVIWENREAIVRQPKSEQGKRAVILPPRVTQIILDHYKTISLDPEALLFERSPGTNVHWKEGQLRPLWQNLRALAGFTGRFHSLRAFAATQFGLTGATAQEIMDRFGHKDLKTSMLYQRPTGREADLVRLLG
jgi:integrase